MHILHYCPHPGGFMYEWHRLHFLDELENAGYVITDCNPIKTLGRPGTAAEYSEVLLTTAKLVVSQQGPHLFLAASGFDSNILPSAIDQIRSLGMVAVNLCFDTNTAPFRVKKVGSHFDLVWVPDMGVEHILRGYGCNTIYMAYAANPQFFKSSAQKREHILCFMGSRFGARTQYIAKLSQAGIPLRIRGNGWCSGAPVSAKGHKKTPFIQWLWSQSKLIYEYARIPAGRKMIASATKKRLGTQVRYEEALVTDTLDLGPGVPFDQMVSTYGSCTASLGVLEVANTYLLTEPMYQVRLRDFEAPMMGCAHLVRRIPELEEAFEEDSEMIFYSSIEECVDKARFYLATQQQERVEAIGRRARVRAEKEHSWIQRFAKLRGILEI